jgi:lipopolysaccharide transport system ATP-binding protein
MRRLRRGWSGGPKRAKRETFWALRDISLEIAQGEVVGIIGRNGAGKSTLLKILSRITEPTSGYADIYGRVGSLLEVGTGFHPELTGRENIFLNGAILGMSRRDIARQFDEIVAFAEVEKFVDTPVKHYSSGMYLRLAFAIAAHLEPDILLVDEVLAVGDLNFQKKCLGKMGEVAHHGRTVLFVSHNMGAIRSLCEKGVVLDKGKVVESGSIGKAIETYYRLSSDQSTQTREYGEDEGGFAPVQLSSHSSSTIDQGDAIGLSTRMHLGSNLAGWILLCVMEDMHQRPVLHLRIDSTDIAGDSVNPGWYDVRLKLPPLWLEPGLYSLYFKAMLSGQVTQARVVSDILHVDVGGHSSGWGAVLSPHAQWSIEPADRATMAAMGEG